MQNSLQYYLHGWRMTREQDIVLVISLATVERLARQLCLCLATGHRRPPRKYTIAATPSLLNLHIQAHAKILLRPTPLLFLSSPLLSLKFASGSLKNCLLFTLNKLICIPWRKRSEVISKTTRCKQKLSAGSNGLKTLRGEVRCFCCVYMWPCE